jgi:hypothetical protein
MSALAKEAVTTPIPVQLSEAEFKEFIFPHLSRFCRKVAFSGIFEFVSH